MITTSSTYQELKNISISDLLNVHERILPYINRTPVMTSSYIDKLTDTSLFFKCENFQKVGAFKMRGATNAALNLRDSQLKMGLATHSSGNHAQAVALSAQMQGVPSYIVVPQNAPVIKRKATEGYGAKIVQSGNRIQDREQMLDKVIAETEATFIHPYNDIHVIQGQSTVALELMQEVDDLDCIVAPVGGGGLLSGTLLAAKCVGNHIKVYGAEPQQVDDAYRSLQKGTIQSNDHVNTIADGLRTQLGSLTFAVIRKHVKGIITVTESQILEAMRLIWERMKILVEPSAAVPLAVVLNNKGVFRKSRVGILLSGGNVDLNALPF